MYFEDFHTWDKFQTIGRTITETDIVLFASITGAHNPLFLDEEFAKTTRFKTRIVPGLLTASMATGLVYLLPQGLFTDGFLALTEISCRARLPVKVGDTLHCTVEVVEAKDGKQPGTGVVKLHTSCLNQKNENVMDIDTVIVVYKKGNPSA